MGACTILLEHAAARCLGSPPSVPRPLLSPSTCSQLCGHLETTRLGRRVLVKAPSRPVAASAIGALLFQLRHALDASTQLADSRWSYYLDSVGAARQHGDPVMLVQGRPMRPSLPGRLWLPPLLPPTTAVLDPCRARSASGLSLAR